MMKRRMPGVDLGVWLALAIVLGAVLMTWAFWAAVLYVGVHFIHKWW